MNQNLTAKQKLGNLFQRLKGEKETHEPENIGLYELHRLPSSNQWYLKFKDAPGKNAFLPGKLAENEIIETINENPGKDQFQIKQILCIKHPSLFKSKYKYGFNISTNGKSKSQLTWCNSSNKCGAIKQGYEERVMDYLNDNPDLESRFSKGEINSKQLSELVNSHFNAPVIKTRKSNGEYFHVKTESKVENLKQDILKINENGNDDHKLDQLVHNPLMKTLIMNKEDAELAVAREYVEEIKSLKCPRCGEQLRLCINRGTRVTRNRGEIFFGCSNYSKNSRSDCRFTLPITGLVYVLHKDMIDEYIFNDAEDNAHLPLSRTYYRRYVVMYHDIVKGFVKDRRRS